MTISVIANFKAKSDQKETYLLLVEVAAMLLLGALVAAYHLGKREPGAEEDNK
ncbi:hypothetical protein [Klebsiella pneumoniae]|uniref:hypothetical protein n=1 Tax=Klebsiella pneumoniae TaxID=573 RepID=UPI002689F32D